MAGINLSQTLQEKQEKARGNFFDTGFYINAVILLLVGVTFLGVRWYLSSLESQIVQTDTEITTRTAQLEGKEAERVADFRDRLDSIEKNLAAAPDSSALFTSLEGSLLPNVKLTRYEENWKDQEATIEGVTDNLKYVAQLMLSLKKRSDIAKVTVEGLSYNDKGLLEFQLAMSRNRASE